MGRREDECKSFGVKHYRAVIETMTKIKGMMKVPAKFRCFKAGAGKQEEKNRARAMQVRVAPPPAAAAPARVHTRAHTHRERASTSRVATEPPAAARAAACRKRLMSTRISSSHGTVANIITQYAPYTSCTILSCAVVLPHTRRLRS